MADDESAVLAANSAFYTAFAAADIKAMEAIWARQDAVACIHPGWGLLAGRDEVIESWGRIFDNAPPDIICHDARAFLLGDTAYVVCLELMPQGVLIATNLFEMSRLPTPIICVVIGEGGSGGALGIGVGDRVSLLEHAYYSVISPEGCAGILWKEANDKTKPLAAEALKLGDRILIMRDGEIVQVGRPDEVVARPADDYVREFTSDVPRSHVLTLRWVMRPVTDEVGPDAPVLSCDTIVREAARVVLDHHGPVLVAEGDRVVGMVDDDDILRVVVAEQR